MALFKKNDKVCFIHETKIRTGTIHQVGKIFDIKVSSGEVLRAGERYVAPIEAKFSIVKSDPDFSNYVKIRFDYTTYALRNKTWEHWKNPASWIVESFDPVQLCLKSTVYGLEIHRI